MITFLPSEPTLKMITFQDLGSNQNRLSTCLSPRLSASLADPSAVLYGAIKWLPAIHTFVQGSSFPPGNIDVEKFSLEALAPTLETFGPASPLAFDTSRSRWT
jgi:hypothetical protein